MPAIHRKICCRWETSPGSLASCAATATNTLAPIEGVGKRSPPLTRGAPAAILRPDLSPDVSAKGAFGERRFQHLPPISRTHTVGRRRGAPLNQRANQPIRTLSAVGVVPDTPRRFVDSI